MFVIGIDPHKASHTATVLDGHERLVGEVRVHADRSQRDRLLAFAARFEPRCWAIEGATGTVRRDDITATQVWVRLSRPDLRCPDITLRVDGE